MSIRHAFGWLAVAAALLTFACSATGAAPQAREEVAPRAAASEAMVQYHVCLANEDSVAVPLPP